MPSYLILRVVAFIVGVCVPMFFVDPFAFAACVMPLTIAHYFLAVPYSRNYVVNVMKRRSTGTYFLALIAASLVLSSIKIPGLLFFAFGIHFVFTEVYLMYENVFPGRWKDTRALRASSTISSIFVYLASIRSPLFNYNHQAEIFYWSGYVISTCVFASYLLRLRKSLTKEQLLHSCAFEALGLAFVITGIMHPILIGNFIFYHVLFWVFYPSWSMIERRKMKALVVYLASNLALTIFFALVSPYSPLPYHLNNVDWLRFFTAGALVHIIISFGMTTAQPAWITRIFHPDFKRQEISLPSQSQAPASVPNPLPIAP